MDATAALGFLAGIFTASAQVPQVRKTLRTRSAEDLSGRMLAILATGLALWVAYGAFIRSWPVMVCNAASLSLVTTLLLLKKRFDRQPSVRQLRRVPSKAA